MTSSITRMTVTLRLGSVLTALALAAFGCSSTSSSAPAAGTDAQSADAAAEGGEEDGGDEDSAVADSGAPLDTAPTDTGSAPDTKVADTSVADTKAPCNSLTDLSSTTLTFIDGNVPPPLGGQPMPGTYVLSSAVQYGGSYIPVGVYGTIQIGTSALQRAVKSVTSTQQYNITSGGPNTITLVETCGSMVDTTITRKYTATSTTYIEHVPQFGGTQVLTYEKN